MKKLLAIILCLGLVFSLSACMAMPKDASNNSDAQDKTSSVGEAKELARDEAIDIALKEAGVSKEDVFDLEAEIDYEKGVKVWQVDFDHGNREYSYNIDFTTGRIVEQDKDLNY